MGMDKSPSSEDIFRLKLNMYFSCSYGAVNEVVEGLVCGQVLRLNLEHYKGEEP